jgi:hypothetical protein
MKRSISSDPNRVFDDPGPIKELVDDMHKHIRERQSPEKDE